MTYRLDVAAPLGREVRRVALAEIDAAIDELRTVSRTRRKGFHLARKRFKKLRGLLRLIRGHDRRFYRDMNGRLRDVARALADMREASALVETVDRFRHEFGDADEDGRLDRIRVALVRRMRAASDRSGGVRKRARDAVSACRRIRKRFAALDMPADRARSRKIVRHGFERERARACAALSDANAFARTEDFHELRKSVKYHWMHDRLLPRRFTGHASGRRAALKSLGEMLGELNDIGVMRDLIDRKGTKLAADADIAFFMSLLDRKEHELRASTVAEAGALFADPVDERARIRPHRRRDRSTARSGRAGARDGTARKSGKVQMPGNMS